MATVAKPEELVLRLMPYASNSLYGTWVAPHGERLKLCWHGLADWWDYPRPRPVRGEWHAMDGGPVAAMYHPAYPKQRTKMWLRLTRTRHPESYRYKVATGDPYRPVGAFWTTYGMTVYMGQPLHLQDIELQDGIVLHILRPVGLLDGWVSLIYQEG